jgi:predicted O-linked N-acetylglucosamine transferase (SPINDLY family)
VVALLERAGVRIDEIIVPQGHAEYLRALAGMKAVINTAPYSGGLTTIEAMALGVEIITPSGAGKLFCERHHLSHRVTAGRNPALAGAIMDLVMN